ncbi:hypothetical protein ACWGJ2_36555 [Streptomyces sp. NPDC054796]
MGDADLQIPKETIDRLTKGIRAAMAELKEIHDATGAETGKGFDSLAMTGMETGHHGLSTEFEAFAERWEWGVRALLQDANQLAVRLGLSAGMLWEEDQYWAGTLKVGLNSLIGNPHASEDEVQNQSWSDIATPDAPDWSAESWRQAGDEMGQTWKDTGRSLTEDGMGGMRTDLMNDVVGISDEDAERARDQLFGPSPEERAQQQQQQGQ